MGRFPRFPVHTGGSDEEPGRGNGFQDEGGNSQARNRFTGCVRGQLVISLLNPLIEVTACGSVHVKT